MLGRTGISLAIAGQLSCVSGVHFGSALIHLYRFLRDERFDNWLLTEQMLRLLGGRRQPILLALDLTQWSDRSSVLAAANYAVMCLIPIAVSARRKPHMAHSQNLSIISTGSLTRYGGKIGASILTFKFAAGA